MGDILSAISRKAFKCRMGRTPCLPNGDIPIAADAPGDRADYQNRPHPAAEAAVSLRTARRWVRRYRECRPDRTVADLELAATLFRR
jgi:hypothetical protein